MVLCKGYTKDNRKCENKARNGCKFCGINNPNRKKSKKRKKSKGGSNSTNNIGGDTMNDLIINVGLGLLGLAVTSLSGKFVKIKPLLNDLFSLAEDWREVNKDKKQTVAEKAKLYDDVVKVVKDIQAIFKGLWFNKSK